MDQVPMKVATTFGVIHSGLTEVWVMDWFLFVENKILLYASSGDDGICL